MNKEISNTGKRLKEFCQEYNTPFGRVIKATNISTNAYQWFSTKREISLGKIEKICESFGEPLSAFFSGYDDRDLTDSQKKFLLSWRRLSKPEKERVLEIIELFEKLKIEF